MAQRVSSYTTLDRAVAEITRQIERADPTAEVVALDFRSKSIASRNPGSAGTHSMSGRSDEGYVVRGAADINVYRKGTRTPHPREWALLAKYGKPLAVRYGLAYTFPKGPNVYLRSHSGASLHLHIDVSIWGTDYGDCYSPFRSGRGGYYRQAHAGRPKAYPPKIGGSKPAPSKPSTTVLRYGSTGARVKALQTGLRRVFPSYGPAKVDGSFGPATLRAVKDFQRRSRLTADGVVGPKTQAALAKHGIRF